MTGGDQLPKARQPIRACAQEGWMVLAVMAGTLTVGVIDGVIVLGLWLVYVLGFSGAYVVDAEKQTIEWLRVPRGPRWDTFVVPAR